MQVLAGDIGGTKTLLALAEVSPDPAAAGPLRVALLETRRYESRAFPGLGAVCQQFASELGVKLPPQAGFGVAGPVVDGRCQATNLPWVLDEGDLRRALGLTRVTLANDFLALGLGISSVQPQDLVALNEGLRDPQGPWAILGAGTGLGEAMSFARPDGHRQVLATEGGHASFAPRDEREVQVLRILLRRFEHVSWERVLSGDGLVSLAEALAEISGRPLPARLAELARDDRAQAPAEVTSSQDPLCLEAVDLFCSLYGAEAGNFALKTLATGGVFVAGGIAPRILPALCAGGFREAFVGKGRMRPLLERMPVHIVLDDDAALLGAAALAATPATATPDTATSAAATPARERAKA